MLGDDHPETGSAYDNLALFIDDQGRSTEAEPLFRKALLIRTKSLGSEHPDTITSSSNLGANLVAQAATQRPKCSCARR